MYLYLCTYQVWIAFQIVYTYIGVLYTSHIMCIDKQVFYSEYLDIHVCLRLNISVFHLLMLFVCLEL